MPNPLKLIVLAVALYSFSGGVIAQAANDDYPKMAPLDQYLIADENAEIALARSAAPSSISDAAEVMVLKRDGYETVVKGTNGFMITVDVASTDVKAAPMAGTK